MMPNNLRIFHPISQPSRDQANQQINTNINRIPDCKCIRICIFSKVCIYYNTYKTYNYFEEAVPEIISNSSSGGSDSVVLYDVVISFSLAAFDGL